MHKLKIFISYSHANLEFAKDLYRRLQAVGHSPWMDQFELPMGEPWADHVEEALLGAEVVIGLLSTDSVRSDNVKNELDLALANQKKLIPIRLEECQVPLNLIRLNYIDFARANKIPSWEQLEIELERFKEPSRQFRDWDKVKAFLPSETFLELQKFNPEERPAQCLPRLHALLQTVLTFLPPHLALSLLENPLPPEQQIKGEFLEGILLFAQLTPDPLIALLPQAQNPKEQAEAVTSLISRCLELILPILARDGGRFIRFNGDTLLCLFPGTPQGALSAVSAAFEMKSKLSEWQIDTSQRITPLDFRVGGSTGSLFSAVIGTPDRLFYLLTGSLAEYPYSAREMPEQGEVLIGQETASLIQDSLTVAAIPQSQSFVRAVSLLKEPAETTSTLWEDIKARLENFKDDLPTLVDALVAVTPHLPAGILAQLVYDPTDPPLEGQYRQVTVAAVNCTGFSQLIQGYGPGYPNDITRVLNLFFKAMQDEVVYYGGTILRLDLYNPGDLLLAIFGAPIAHEKDTQRACLAARGMQNAIQRLPSEIRSLIKLSIGIDTGFAFAGTFGSSQVSQRGYSVLGRTVQSAEKLMGAAGPGKIIASQAVWRTLGGAFDGQETSLSPEGFDAGLLPAVSLGEPVSIQLERLVSDGRTGALVGRTSELQKLSEAFETAILDHSLTLLAVTGEAGVGKSRLVREWMAKSRQLAQASWITVTAHSYGQKAHGIFIELVEKYLKWEEVTSNQDRLGRLFDTIKAFNSGEGPGWLQVCLDQQAYLGHFMGLNLNEQPRLLARIRPLDAESLQINTRQALCDLLTHAARIQPLVIILDDLHWADLESLELLHFVVQKLDFSLPILFCLLFRSLKENPATTAWQTLANENPNCITLPLSELPQADAGTMLSNLLISNQLPTGFQAFIQKKTDGNPLYMEELLNNMIESGAIRSINGQWQLADDSQPVPVPDSLYQIIQSRIDQLDFSSPGSRRLLWIAATSGDECSEDLLWQVYQSTGRPRQEYSRQLKELMNAALLERKAPKDRKDAASLEYQFRHNLVQQVAYENIPAGLQSEYHASIGRFLENKFSRSDEQKNRFASLLAHHFDKGRQWDAAFHYHLLAGQSDAQAFANDIALAHLNRALEIAQNTPQAGPDMVQAHVQLARLQALIGQFAEAQLHFETALDRLSSNVDEAAMFLRARICYEIGRIFERQGGHANLEIALSWQEKGLQILSGRPDCAEKALMHILGGIVGIRWPDLDRANPQIKTALQTAKAAGARPELALAHRVASISERAQGNLPSALDHCRQAAAICDELQDWIGKAKDLANQGVIALEMDDWSIARQVYLQALDLQEKIGDKYQLAMTCCNLGDLYFHLGDLEPGLESARRGLEIFQKIDAPEGVLFAQNVLATLFWRTGDLPSAEEAMLTARRLEEKLQDSEFHASIGRWLAQVYLSQGNLPKAEAELDALHALSSDDLGQESASVERLSAQTEGLKGNLVEGIHRLSLTLANPDDAASRYETACNQLALAKLLLQSGQAVLAREQASQAQQVFDALGARMDNGEAGALLAKI
jgi:adenylate cyclase